MQDTVKTVLHKLIEESPRLGAATKRGYLTDVDRWIKFAGADPAKWTRYLTQEFYTELRKEMKPQSANRVIMSLRYAASWWAKMESKPELDFTQIQLARKTTRARREALTEDEATALIRAAASSSEQANRLRDFALIVVGLETGMRRSSLADMAIERTTLKSPIGAITEVAIKGRDERYKVPLSKTAARALAPWLAWLTTHKITTGGVFRALLDRVERDEVIGEGVSDRQVYNIVDALAKRAEITRQIHPHLFRHSFVTWRLMAEVDTHIISLTTGHRLKGESMGAMKAYMTEDKLYDLARATTPPWLTALVEQLTKGAT